MNCWIDPLATDGFVGVTAIDDSVAAVTVTSEKSKMRPMVAVMVAGPTARADTMPLLPPALDTEATEGADDTQVADAVRSWVESSVYVPITWNSSAVPLAIVGSMGRTSRVARVAAVTVRIDVSKMPPKVAVMVVEPCATLSARPWEPLALEIVATARDDELQVTCAVRSWTVLSL